MKKKILLLLLIVCIISLTGCNRNGDGIKFKSEYESLNGRKTDDGKHKYRSISINRKNKIKYADCSDIVKMMKDKKSFVVYFGFDKCPWCRSVLEELIKASNDSSIDTVYYVDVYDVRDVKEFSDGKVVTTKEGDTNYMKLVDMMSGVLDDYTVDDKSMGEKRIYAPNVVAVVNGKADKMTTGISSKLTDPYMKLNKDIRNYAYKNFKCMMKCVTDSKNVCTKDSKC